MRKVAAFFITLVLSVIILLPSLTLAQSNPNPQPTPCPGYQFRDTLFSPNSSICAKDYLKRLYLWAVGLAILGSSGMIIYAGYKYTVGKGNPTEVSNAKEIIVSTLVGLALLLLSYTILRFLGIRFAP
jgi:hypothetical protein